MEAKEKNLIFMYTALAVITMTALITWSIFKKDYVELAVNTIAALVAIVWIAVIFSLLFNVENKHSDSCLSFVEFTEVVSLSQQTESHQYYAKLCQEGFYGFDIIVKIFKAENDQKIFFSVVKIEDFEKFYKIK